MLRFHQPKGKGRAAGSSRAAPPPSPPPRPGLAAKEQEARRRRGRGEADGAYLRVPDVSAVYDPERQVREVTVAAMCKEVELIWAKLSAEGDRSSKRSSHRLCHTSVVCKELKPRALVGEAMPTKRGSTGSSFEKVEKKVISMRKTLSGSPGSGDAPPPELFRTPLKPRLVFALPHAENIDALPRITAYTYSAAYGAWASPTYVVSGQAADGRLQLREVLPDEDGPNEDEDDDDGSRISVSVARSLDTTSGRSTPAPGADDDADDAPPSPGASMSLDHRLSGRGRTTDGSLLVGQLSGVLEHEEENAELAGLASRGGR